MLFPDAWEQYLAPIPQAERGDLIARLPPAPDHAATAVAAPRPRAPGVVWEGATSYLLQDPKPRRQVCGERRLRLAFARIECHYFVNGGFFEHDDQLLATSQRIRHIPAVIVQGRYDVVCPMRSAWELHRAWPEADLRIVPDAGHSAFEPGNLHELITATDRFRA